MGKKTASELVGQSAPDFTLPCVGGGQIRLSSLRGRAVLLDFIHHPS
jgi:peroxiredoxin